jgi:integrase
MQNRVRGEKRLRAKEVAALPPGVHEDGGGLRLVVEPPRGKKPGARRWVLRVTIAGKRHNRGLGPYPLVSLDQARNEAGDVRRAAREGRDLLTERRAAQARSVTFRQAHETMFASEKHVEQWLSTMDRYVFPRIGNILVSDVKHSDIIAILKPVWFEKPQTASRLMQRMELVFKSAIRHGHREKASPCDGVAEELGRRNHAVQHFRALPYEEVAAFLPKLRTCSSSPAVRLAFEWLILTATRSGEARGARWHEIDEADATWTISKERMKGRRDHVVPLSKRCLEIVKEARALHSGSPLLFPSPQTGEPLADMTLVWVLRDLAMKDQATVHGFRSTFRDWATEVDKVREVVAEAALAHAVKDKTEAAYRRAAYLDERRGLMERAAPGIPEAAEAAQVPAAEQGAAPAEDTPASVAKDLPTPPPTVPNGAATGDATSAAATAN